jgi:hypothetical protein
MRARLRAHASSQHPKNCEYRPPFFRRFGFMLRQVSQGQVGRDSVPNLLHGVRRQARELEVLLDPGGIDRGGQERGARCTAQASRTCAGVVPRRCAMPRITGWSSTLGSSHDPAVQQSRSARARLPIAARRCADFTASAQPIVPAMSLARTGHRSTGSREPLCHPRSP